MSDEDDDELVQVSHMVPETLRDRATENTEHGGISEAVREVYRILANNGTMSQVRLELQLRKIRKDRTRIEDEIDDLEAQLNHLADREDELEDRADTANSREAQYEDLLAEMDTMLQNGERVFETHGKVQNAADLSDQTPQEVIETLKERNPDLDDSKFTSKLSGSSWRDSYE